MGAMNFKNIGSVEYGNNKIYKIYANDGLISSYSNVGFHINIFISVQILIALGNFLYVHRIMERFQNICLLMAQKQYLALIMLYITQVEQIYFLVYKEIVI